MSETSKAVRVLIEADFGTESLTQRVEGELFDKGTSVYLRYREPDPEMGKTTTTVKWTDGEIKIMRHGDVRSEQSFAAGRRLPGYYGNSQGRAELATETKTLAVDKSDNAQTLRWSYDLFFGEEHVGTYRLQMKVQEDEQ